MRVLLAGDWHSNLHEEPVAAALGYLGHTVGRFAWYRYFCRPQRGPLRFARHLSRRFQNKYVSGPSVRHLNEDLVREAARVRPELLFVYRGTHVFPETLRAIRSVVPSAVIAGYSNDDPFSPVASRSLWHHFLRSLPEYEIMFAYRHANVEQFLQAGARHTALLRSWFIPERMRPVTLTAKEQKRFGSEVTFIGHYEADGRVEMLKAIVDRQIGLRLLGPGKREGSGDWDGAIRAFAQMRHLIPVRPVWNEDYNSALCGAKIALCFLSKLNRDTYTRRCFEIPASGTLMLSEYSPDLATLFKEGVEADFFRSKAELVEKVEYYLTNNEARARVADAGRRRVIADGHDVVSRMREMLSCVEGLR
jgi:spore maturation protein CgeB